MASTKTRSRPQQGPPTTNVVMSTPPPPLSRNKGKSTFSEAEKQGLLQNFDLEVADKTAYFRSVLARTLTSFRMREESEILSIPRELRSMTLGELEAKWGGGWAGTLQRIRRESFEAREKVREEKEEKEREEVVKGKRKRNNTATSSPDRQSKNARRDLTSSTSATTAPLRKSTRTNSNNAAASSSTSTRASAKNTKKKVLSDSSGPSTLPQNHIFNPSLPPTPFRKNLTSSSSSVPPSPLSQSTRPLSQSQSQSKSTSSLSRTANNTRGGAGVPRSIASSRSSQPPSDSGDEHDGSQSDPDEAEAEEEEGNGDDADADADAASDASDDLPDPEALEAKYGGAPTNSAYQSQTPNSKPKKKRGPSLIFRKSLAPGHLAAKILPHDPKAGNTDSNGVSSNGPRAESGLGEDGEPISTIHLTDGRTISFNPLSLTPGRVDRELQDGGVSAGEKKKVQEMVHEAVVRSLRERMEKWSV
ncbi:hypothetical protein I317_04691 [Kwoniella heveanensis CBS 569]|nr:hypothetical protein I317_04691 [Kwoniella heveanensis CBS 569]